MPTAVQLLLDRHGAKAPRDDGSELPAGFGMTYPRMACGDFEPLRKVGLKKSHFRVGRYPAFFLPSFASNARAFLGYRPLHQ